MVTLAALINALKVARREVNECRLIINGAGAAGITICKLLLAYGFKDLIICDSKGAIYQGRPEGMNPAKEALAKKTNQYMKKGSLQDVIEGRNVFIGVSAAGALKGEWIKKME